MNPLPKRRMSFYEKYIKRVLDVTCCVLALIFFWWVYLIVALLVRVNLGSPVIFKQPRPGLVDEEGQEKIFLMYKFRTMTDERGDDGKLLSDDARITRFGKMLRATSLDELPETFNILKGDMSIVGPRPQLVRDMVFMSERQRMRHTAKPGLSGLAQIKGRNSITWESKIEMDLKYIKKVTFLKDIKIVLDTAKKVFIRSNITQSNNEIDFTLDYGDALLKNGIVSQDEYDKKQSEADKLLVKMNC